MSTFGIDLGTTNSVISRIVAGRPEAIAIDGSPIVPSVVLYGADGGIVVGREARNLALLHPDRTVASVKRSMGRSQHIAIAGRTVPPEAVAAEILGALKRGAEKATGEAVREVVVTVPAYFDDAQRQATLRAADLAGLRVLRLINEPTASSLVYDQVADASDEPHTMLVYDLGGGTFDVSVLDVFGDVREVKATNGDTNLGGDDFDRLLVGLFRQQLQRDGVDVRSDAVAMARLLRLAEETKIALSEDVVTQARAEFIAERAGKPVHLDLQVRRSDFEELIIPHLDRTIDMAREAVAAAGLDDAGIDRICLVGGSTRIPLVRQMLDDAFAADVHEEVDVDLAVSLGAAVQAAVLGGAPVTKVLVDVTAHDLGILAIDELGDRDSFAPVIHRNTVLPTRRVREFYTAYDGQKLVQVEVFQGNTPSCSRNRKIGEFEFPLTPGPSGSAVRVEFAYDLNGTVRVSCQQSGGGSEKSVALRVADATTPEAVQALPVAPSALERKAGELAARLDGPARARLEALLERFRAAVGSERERAEEALLDFFVDQDD